MLRLRKISAGIIPIMMVILLFSTINTTLNKHYHRLSSGVILTHAHPFSKGNTGSPFREHNHSQAEYILLEQISLNIFWICLFIFLSVPFLIGRDFFYGSELIFGKGADLFFLKNYHAPPDNFLSIGSR